MTRLAGVALLAVLLAAPTGHAADIDRAAVDFKTPAEIEWVRNTAGTIQVWGMGPATATPAEKR